MVLQDIKNTSGSDSETVVPSRKRGERCKKSAAEDVPLKPQENSSSDITDLPLLQRIQLQMAMSTVNKDGSNETQADNNSDDNCDEKLQQSIEEDPAYDPEASITMDVSLEDDGKTPNKQRPAPELDFLAAPTPSRLDESEGFNRAFFDLSGIDKSVATPQVGLFDTSAGTSLTCTEHIQELDTTPKTSRVEIPVSQQQNKDKLDKVTSSTLMSPDLLQIAEGYREDRDTNPPPTPVSDDTHPLKKESQAGEEHIKSQCSSSPTHKNLLEELDLQVEAGVSGRKRRKATRRQSQQVFDIPGNRGEDRGVTILEDIRKLDDGEYANDIHLYKYCQG